MVIKLIIGLVILVLLAMIICVVVIFAKPQIIDKTKDANGDVISSDGKSGGVSESERVGDTKSFVPVVSIDNHSFDMGRHTYRAIIECSSVNYNLMSVMEQQMVETTYTRFLNSLSFPITFYVQTREFDSDVMLENLHKNIIASEKRFPTIKDYAVEYEEEMRHLTDYINNSKIKKKYIIIPFNRSDLQDVSALTNYEIKEFALEELMNRCNIIISGLTGVGLSAKLLNRAEIAECLYSYYHRDMYKIASDIASGSFSSLVVEGENYKEIGIRETLDAILLETQNKIKNGLFRNDMSEQEQVFYRYIIDCLEYFKQNDRGADIVTLLDRSANTAYQNGYGTEYENYMASHPENYPLYTQYHSEDGMEQVVPRYFQQ